MTTQTQITPETYTFAMKGNYLSEGRVNIDLAKEDVLWLSLKINAEGGENALHAHSAEEHAFIVLEGEVTFFNKEEEGTVLHKYEGIMIPKGAYYRYLNTGGENLFLLRVGAKLGAQQGDATRLRTDGTQLPSNSAENHHIDGVPIPGKIWGAS
ncbi:MAG: cupin domain-containing protein [Chloroflexota bacterium]